MRPLTTPLDQLALGTQTAILAGSQVSELLAQTPREMCCDHQCPGAGAASEPLLEPVGPFSEPGARRSPGQRAPLAGTWSD